MFIKLFLALVLGMSIASFAGSSEGGFKSAVDSVHQNQSSTEAKQTSELKSRLPNKQQKPDALQPLQQESDANQKPSIIDYCRKHTC